MALVWRHRRNADLVGAHPRRGGPAAAHKRGMTELMESTAMVRPRRACMRWSSGALTSKPLMSEPLGSRPLGSKLVASSLRRTIWMVGRLSGAHDAEHALTALGGARQRRPRDLGKVRAAGDHGVGGADAGDDDALDVQPPAWRTGPCPPPSSRVQMSARHWAPPARRSPRPAARARGSAIASGEHDDGGDKQTNRRFRHGRAPRTTGIVGSWSRGQAIRNRA